MVDCQKYEKLAKKAGSRQGVAYYYGQYVLLRLLLDRLNEKGEEEHGTLDDLLLPRLPVGRP